MPSRLHLRVSNCSLPFGTVAIKPMSLRGGSEGATRQSPSTLRKLAGDCHASGVQLPVKLQLEEYAERIIATGRECPKDAV